MPGITETIYFIFAACILIIAPGPDIIFLITQSIHKGHRAGLTTALGLASGNLIHTLVAAFGISALILNSPIALSAIKVIGACYLLYLAYDAIKQDKHSTYTSDQSIQATDISLFLRGFLMNALNPKVTLFFLAFLPQFTNIKNGSIQFQMIFFGIIFTSLVVLIFGSIGYFAGQINLTNINKSGVSNFARWATAIIFTGLSLNIILF